MLKPFGNVWQADVNFDGHTDIMICLGTMPASDQVITYYDAWLYNPQTGKFNYHEGFRDIANPEVDTVNKYVTSHYLLRDGETKQYVALTIQNDGTQKLTHGVSGTLTDNHSVHLLTVGIVDVQETLLHLLLGYKGLDDAQASQCLVQLGYDAAPLTLYAGRLTL